MSVYTGIQLSISQQRTGFINVLSFGLVFLSSKSQAVNNMQAAQVNVVLKYFANITFLF
ncbi:hypothetical protein EVA_16333 [gut metagenome]|uniref:Uncharacterized protein n=1 Tax=gut metagenome TaxID=749906 RepID=J9C6X4_9ZZZZ